MLRKLLLTTVFATSFALVADDNTVEVLHWWTSGGEAAALNVLKKDLESKGVTWQDMPVAGGGGEQAMTALRARVTAGNPPTAVQMLGFDITDWAKQGVVADLNDLAGKEGLDKLGLKQPTTWDELIADLDAIKAAGYTAVAHGGVPWQEATIFDAVVMST